MFLILRENNLDHVVECIKGKIEDIELPVKEVIIPLCDWPFNLTSWIWLDRSNYYLNKPITVHLLTNHDNLKPDLQTNQIPTGRHNYLWVDGILPSLWIDARLGPVGEGSLPQQERGTPATQQVQHVRRRLRVRRHDGEEDQVLGRRLRLSNDVHEGRHVGRCRCRNTG